MSKRAEEATMKYFPEQVNRDDYFNDDDYIEAAVRQKSDEVLFRIGYMQAEKETIERACEWLFSHLPILVDYYDEDIHTNADRSEFIKLFRTQMEEQI